MTVWELWRWAGAVRRRGRGADSTNQRAHGKMKVRIPTLEKRRVGHPQFGRSLIGRGPQSRADSVGGGRSGIHATDNFVGRPMNSQMFIG
jgi:hypothetical protein